MKSGKKDNKVQIRNFWSDKVVNVIKIFCYIFGHSWEQNELDPWEDPDYCSICRRPGRNKW